MNTLLVATSNPGKLNEIRFFLRGLPITIICLKDVGLAADSPEDADTFEKNAVMKAEYYAKKSNLPTVADDGGLEIDALNGEPGVKSHRWISGEKDDEDEQLIAYTLKRMKNLPVNDRHAQLHLVLAYAVPGRRTVTSEGIIRGIIPTEASDIRTKGFPFRSLLFIPSINKFYDHKIMTEDETQKLNHRGKAVRNLIPAIKKSFGIV